MKNFFLTLIALTLSVAITCAQGFHPFLKDKVLTLQNGELKPLRDFQAPKKYYVFYQSASWCTYCKVFTPKLKRFSKDFQKKYGDDFSVIVISSDRNFKDQVKYSVSSGIDWPQLSYQDSQKFLKEIKFDSEDLPNLIVYSAAGEFLYTKHTMTTNKGNIDHALKKLETLLAR